MPYKKCPKCKQDNGVRSKTCKGCGESFLTEPLTKEETPAKIGKKPKSVMHIEKAATGVWVYDHKKGMPEVEVPPDLRMHDVLDDEAIRLNIEYHGLGYCIFYYLREKHIKDKKLAALFEEARLAMLKVQRYLYD